MLNLTLALVATLVEVCAWALPHLLRADANSALLAFFIIHAMASVLFGLSLYPLIHGLPYLRDQRSALVALTAVVSFAVPIAGPIGCFIAFFALLRHRNPSLQHPFPSVNLPEFDQSQASSHKRRPPGLGTFLSNQSVPTAARMRAMVALGSVSGKLASPLLRNALSDSNDDLRLLAYSMLDNKEQQISQAIHEAQQKLEQAQETEGSDVLGPQGIQACWTLSDLYWEMIYQGVTQSDVKDHAIAQSLHYCESVLAMQPNNALLTLRKGRLMQLRHEYQQAQNAYEEALAMGLPAARVTPYLAEIHFLQRHFSQAQALMQTLDPAQAPPRLLANMKYWSAA